MKPTIQDIRVILTAPQGINLVIVRVDTSEDGLYGLGCATFAYRHTAVKCVVEEYLKPLLLGRDVTAISELWQLMHQNGYWRDGPIANNAISGVDMALWDIKGKMAGMPLYQLFGGKVRTAVPVYQHAEGSTPDEVFASIDCLMEKGLRYIRCQCGGYGGKDVEVPSSGVPAGAPKGIYLDSNAYMQKTIQLFDEIRKRYGFDIALTHDVHERLHPSETMAFMKALDDYRLFFLEDILSPEQMDWLPRLRNASVTPIAIGELFNNPAQWLRHIQNRDIDFIRVHISQIGGITPAWKLQALCESFGVRICWHAPGDMTPMGHAANIHIDMASASFGLQEWSGIEPPNFIISDVSDTPEALIKVFSGLPEYHNGYVYVSEKPGLGIDINEKEAAKYPCSTDVTRWTQTRRYDGSLLLP
jgi:mannonate dehydratase